MIPLGPKEFDDDLINGVMTYKMEGMFAEVFDNLQVVLFANTLVSLTTV